MDWLHHLFEPEETVGAAWHRAAEKIGAERSYPEAAVRLDAEKGRLAVLFRGLGGGGGVELRALPAEPLLCSQKQVQVINFWRPL